MRREPMDTVLHVVARLIRVTVYVTLLLPAIIVVISSLTAGEHMRFPPEGLSLKWYAAIWHSTAFMTSLKVSVQLAVAATLLSLAIGLAAAFALDRHRFVGREAFRSLLLSPLIIPAVVLGIGLIQLFSWWGIGNSFFSLLAGHVVITLPYVVRTLAVSLGLLDRSLEEAAQTLRASRWTILRRITLPLLAPGVLSAAVFAFVVSFGNITLSIFLGSAGAATLPVQIFTYVEHSYDPSLAAVSAVVILVTLFVMLVIDRISGLDRVV